MTTLLADPTQRRQLGFPDLGLIWRETPTGQREGLLLGVSVCGRASCRCADATLGTFAVTDRLTSARVAADGDLRLRWDESGGPAPALVEIVLRLDFESGVVTIDDADLQHPQAAARKAWVEAHCDAPFLDGLHGVWSLARRRDPKRRARLARVDLGEHLAWSAAFPDARRDSYAIGTHVFRVEEHACIKPGCTCADVRLVITAAFDDRELGSFLASPSDPEPREVSLGAGTRAQLDEVWARYRARHDVAARLATVQQECRAAMLHTALALPPPRATPAVGRNEPCPCGSHKKFKKCCGA